MSKANSLTEKRRKTVARLEVDARTGDATLRLNQIKVKDSSTWQKESSAPLSMRSSHATSQKSSDQGKPDTLIIRTCVKVTYYRMQTFMDAFKDYFQSFDVLHQSLSPKYNRDMVFKAG